MSKIDIGYNNYDKTLKEAFSIFNQQVLDFLELNLPKIDRFLETEIVEVQTTQGSMDLNFWLEDGTILHIEEEVNLSKSDLIRFAAYDLKLYDRYRTNINTVVLCIDKVNQENLHIDSGTLKYSIRALDMSDKNGDAKIIELKEKVQNNEEVNILELIFVPLMKSEKEKLDLVKETVELEKQLNIEWRIKEKAMALTLVLSDKLIPRKEIEKIWEGINMLKVIEFAIEKGVQQGIRERGSDILIKLLTKKFGKVPEEYKKNIAELDGDTLDILASEIFDIQDIKQIEKYF